MKRLVRLTTRAKADLLAIVAWYADRDLDAATRWYRLFRESLHRLESSPDRFALAHEAETLQLDVREYLFGSGRSKTHRVFFRVQPHPVEVLAIRHRAQARRNCRRPGHRYRFAVARVSDNRFAPSARWNRTRLNELSASLLTDTSTDSVGPSLLSSRNDHVPPCLLLGHVEE